jgi:hypothetical protein
MVSFTDFIEFLLWRLYVEESRHGAGQLYDLNVIADELLEPADPQWLIDAGKVLESRGLATTAFALGGYGSGMLTGEGRLLVEERLNTEGSFISKLAEHPERYVHWPETGANVSDSVSIRVYRSIEEERRPALTALRQLDEQIDLLAGIDQIDMSDEERRDLHADVETIRAQLRKREPNLPLIAGLLDPITSRWPGLAGYAARLSAFLFS